MNNDKYQEEKEGTELVRVNCTAVIHVVVKEQIQQIKLTLLL